MDQKMEKAGVKDDGVRLPIPRETRALKPDAQPFDRIEIVTVPRWKESGFSGDEWRISARVIFYRKGRKVHEVDYGRNVEAACNAMGYLHANACDDGKGYFAGEGNFCDQEGCSEPATVTYALKEKFCNEGHPHPIASTRLGVDVPTVRKFCDRHENRGDCGLEDADRNYVMLKARKE